MVRSKWIKSLLAALASAGLAAGQQYTERIITVQEAGKPPQKCRVLDTVTLKNGYQQLHVLDLATNEVMTIEETPDGGAHIVAKNIEPIATSVAPPLATQAAAPAAPTLLPASATQPTTLPEATHTTTAAAPTLNVTEPGHATRTVSVLRTSRASDGSKVYQVQTADTHEMLTIVESPAPVAPGNPPGAMTAKIYHWGASTTPPAGAPLPPADSANGTAMRSWPSAYQSKPTTLTQMPAVTPYSQTKTTTAQLPAMTPYSSTQQTPPSTSASSPYLPRTTTQPSTTQAYNTTPAPAALPVNNWMTTPPPAPVAPAPAKTTQPRPAPVVENWLTTNPPPAPTTKTTMPVTPAQLAGSPTSAAPTAVLPAPPVVRQTQATSPIGPPPPDLVSPTQSLPPLSFQPNPSASATTTKKPEQPKDYHQEWGTPAGQPAAKPAKTTETRPATTTAAKPVDPVKQDPLLNPDQFVKPSVEKKVAVPESVTKAMGGDTKPTSTMLSGDMQLPPTGPSHDTPARTTENDHPNTGHTAPTGPKYVPTATTPTTKAAPAGTPGTTAKRMDDKVPPAPVPEPEALNAFTPGPAQQPAGPPLNAFSSGAPQGGYGTPLPMYTPPGYPMMPQAMMPPMPTNPAGAPMQGGQMTVAMRPNTNGYPVVQAAAWQQVQVPTAPMGPIAEPQLPSRGMLSTSQTLAMLHDSLYPSQREWAADQLSMLDWKTSTEVVEALVKAAQEDPAPTVRAGCVRALARMNVNLVPVANALQALKADADPRVKTEVDRALARIAPSATLGKPAGEVQPAAATEPALLGKPNGTPQH